MNTKPKLVGARPDLFITRERGVTDVRLDAEFQMFGHAMLLWVGAGEKNLKVSTQLAIFFLQLKPE